MSLGRSFVLALLAGAAVSPAWAQPAPAGTEAQPAPAAAPEEVDPDAEALDAEGEEGAEVEEVVVTAERRRGAALGDIPPEVELNAQEIRAIGAGTITELLQALEPQIRSNRGRGGEGPITLLNGRRISGFSEIRGIPPEAIERFEVLPEEVALRYGYRADQRVVNIVLRERFRATTAELSAGGPTQGGRLEGGVELGVLRVNRRGRSNVDMEYRRSSSLLESERDVERTSRGGAPFDLLGNAGPATGAAEIDPALSALAGRPITVAGVPAAAAAGAPRLEDFAAGTANITDLGAYRTLLPETEQMSINGTLNRTVLNDVSATVNARFDRNTSQSLFGLPSGTLSLPDENPFSPFASDVRLFRYFAAPGALTRDTESNTGHLGLTLDSYAGSWRWSLTANYDLGVSETLTDVSPDVAALQARIDAGDPALNPFGPLPAELVTARERDSARSVNQTANAELVVNGTLRQLAAGPLSTTVKAAVESRAIDSETRRGGVEQAVDSSRQLGGFQINVDAPLASRRREVRTWLGDLTANANLAVEELSDFGTLTTLGYGVNWSPKERLTLLASFTDEDGAPSIGQLGDPVLVTPNVPFFDFTRGETVEVTAVQGGNPGLVADNRQVVKLGANFRPFEERDLSLSVNYTATRILDPITSFPGATPEIEAAFPDRFQRDETGRLLRVDTRPVNFARADGKELRSGFNWSKSLGPQGAGGRAAAGGPPGQRSGAAAAQTRDAAAGGAPPTGGSRARGGGGPQGEGGGRRFGGPGGGGPGGGGRFGGGGFGPGGGGPGAGRLQFSVYHTWRLEDSILVSEGGPELDLLNGAAVGSRGGRSEHEVDVQAGLFKNGYGGFLNARWQSGTFVNGGQSGRVGQQGDLFFSDLATVNLRLFANLGQQRKLMERYPFLRGSRVSLAVNNLLDARLDVRDEAGAVPVSYQPDLLDPVGRSVRVSFRKLFLPTPAQRREQRERRRSERERTQP